MHFSSKSEQKQRKNMPEKPEQNKEGKKYLEVENLAKQKFKCFGGIKEN